MPSIRRRPNASNQQADVGRFALLLSIVIVVIGLLGLVGSPRTADSAGTVFRVVMTVLAGGVMYSTLRVARVTQREERRFGSLIAGIALIAILGAFITSNPAFGVVISFLWVLLVITAPVLVLRQVLSADYVTIQTLIGAITVYLLIGMSLTFVSIALQESIGFFEVEPRSTAYVYFAFVTITSLGYGDLSPYTDTARMVSIAAAVSAQMYLVVVVARLVAMWKPQRVEPDSSTGP